MPVALVNNRFLPRAQPNGGGAFPGFGGAPPAIASAGSAGVAATASRSDHTHAHGSQTDPTMHALTSAAGGDGFQPQSNRSAAVDPAAGDDSASGYAVGSYWINTSTDEAFVCVDDSVGAAVWESTTVGGSLQDSYDASAGGPPLVTLSAAIGPFAIRDNAAPLGSQRMVDYLKALPYEQVYQLVAGFGALEPVPDSEQLEPQFSSSDGNGSSDEEQPPHAVSVFGASAKLG